MTVVVKNTKLEGIDAPSNIMINKPISSSSRGEIETLMKREGSKISEWKGNNLTEMKETREVGSMEVEWKIDRVTEEINKEGQDQEIENSREIETNEIG